MISLYCILVLSLAAAPAAASAVPVGLDPLQRHRFRQGNTESACRCFPGDPCWPTAEEWSAFNQTVGGKLIATVPIASACHNSFPNVRYDAAACDEVRANWPRPAFHHVTSHSPMASFFANKSCDPFSDPDAPCSVGSYVQYAVRATSAYDYQMTLAFAEAHNIRLVIRNTGHDYLGKSTGAGALALWTQALKDISIFDYSSDGYQGKAMKVGAGVLCEEAEDAAHAEGLAVVCGDCPTVGLAGGYTQGGGTSPLGSTFGLAADQALEWEVVTPQGEYLIATPTSNSDLYWALSGGGGGTYAAVLSLTIKVHPDVKVAGGSLIFSSEGVDPDAFWGVVKTVLMSLPNFIDAGGVALWMLVDGVFLMPQLYLPNQSAEQLKTLILEPVTKALDQAGIQYSQSAVEFPTFLDSFQTLNPDINITEYNVGGRLIPRSLVATDASATVLTNALRAITDKGAHLANVVMNVSRSPTYANAVYPGWRDSLMMVMTAIPYDFDDFEANVAARKKITNEIDPILAEITPGGGAYLNEADYSEPNFQEAFYGSNYERLLSIKKKYDPNNILWGKTAVGSESWDVQADGRLCQTGL
ncbi:hypothetical protein VTK26DRAFT_6797 [Humicola hyalothermophila]